MYQLSIRKSKYPFCTSFVVWDRYLLQFMVLLKSDSNCLRSFILSWLDKVTTGTWSFVSVTWNSGFWFAAVPTTRT